MSIVPPIELRKEIVLEPKPMAGVDIALLWISCKFRGGEAKLASCKNLNHPKQEEV